MLDKKRKMNLESANRLREIRMNMGASQKEMAYNLNMSLSAYKKVEGGENGISVNLLKILKEKYSISADYLLYGEYEEYYQAVKMIQQLDEESIERIFEDLKAYFVQDKKKVYLKKDDRIRKSNEEKKE